MLVIRLQRTGRENVAAYRLVLTEHSAPVRGRVKEYLGHYLPMRNPHVFECDTDRVSHWIGLGARPSDTVARLLHKAGVKDVESFMKRYTKKRKKNAPDEPVAPAAATPPAEPIKDTVEQKPEETSPADPTEPKEDDTAQKAE